MSSIMDGRDVEEWGKKVSSLEREPLIGVRLFELRNCKKAWSLLSGPSGVLKSPPMRRKFWERGRAE